MVLSPPSLLCALPLYSILHPLFPVVHCHTFYKLQTRSSNIHIFRKRVKHQIRPLQHPAETTGAVWLREPTKVTASDWGFMHIQQRPLGKPHWGNRLGFPMRILGTAESPLRQGFQVKEQIIPNRRHLQVVCSRHPSGTSRGSQAEIVTLEFWTRVPVEQSVLSIDELLASLSLQAFFMSWD